MSNCVNGKTKEAYIFFNRSNVEVTRDYLEVIRASLKRIGYSCEFVTSLEGVSKKALIVSAVGIDALFCYLKGYRRLGLWQQGATGSESFMHHKSKIRRAILNFVDCFVMKKSKLVFFVSEYMKQYYEKMAGADFSEKSYVMPCFNETFNRSVLEEKDYSKKVFTYVGSLSVWQCFQETVEVYAKIEKRFPEAFFKVLTFDVETAKQILSENGVKNYSVSCVPKEEVNRELKEATYGFILRQDIDVNRVATPTKISSYLSAGVLPIYSACLKDFYEKANGKSFAYAWDFGEKLDGVLQYVENGVDKSTVLQEVEELFGTYYSKEYHLERIAALAEKCLK